MRNSGIIGGKFLENSRIAKPGMLMIDQRRKSSIKLKNNLLLLKKQEAL